MGQSPSTCSVTLSRLLAMSPVGMTAAWGHGRGARRATRGPQSHAPHSLSGPTHVSGASWPGPNSSASYAFSSWWGMGSKTSFPPPSCAPTPSAPGCCRYSQDPACVGVCVCSGGVRGVGVAGGEASGRNSSSAGLDGR